MSETEQDTYEYDKAINILRVMLWDASGNPEAFYPDDVKDLKKKNKDNI